MKNLCNINACIGYDSWLFWLHKSIDTFIAFILRHIRQRTYIINNSVQSLDAKSQLVYDKLNHILNECPLFRWFPNRIFFREVTSSVIIQLYFCSSVYFSERLRHSAATKNYWKWNDLMIQMATTLWVIHVFIVGILSLWVHSKGRINQMLELSELWNVWKWQKIPYSCASSLKNKRKMIWNVWIMNVIHFIFISNVNSKRFTADSWCASYSFIWRICACVMRTCICI